MDMGAVMNTMRDPAGIPSHPAVFQVLMVVTWIAHIAFVHLTLGCAGLAIVAFHRRASGAYWQRLSMAMTKVAKVAVSLLIVLGVGPLLFTQVIYDPQWYTSNVLSGRWAIAFILTLIVAYCCWFAFYHANQAAAKAHIGVYAWIALALFCLDGLIMHALSYQALLPEKWMDWYAPGGMIDTRGAALHAIQGPRYVFIMSLCVPAVGVFLLAYAQYFSTRADFEAPYRAFVRELGKRIAQWGFSIAIVPMLAWQCCHPASTHLVVHPVGWLILAGLAAMSLYVRRIDEATHGYLPLANSFAILGLLAVWREIIRIRYLKPFGYDIATYPVHTDWPSMILFAATLIGIGGLAGGFYLTLLYRAGRQRGVYYADLCVARLGSGAVAVLALWIVVFFSYGIVVSLHGSIN